MFRQELAVFFGAIRFFTRLPVPAWAGHSAESLQKSSRYMPVIGIVVGGLGGLAFFATSWFWPKTLAVLASMIVTLRVTGVFHEDGWSDMIDGFGGGWEKEQVLAIMKDSRLGNYGAVGLVMMLMSKFFALIEIDALQLPLVLVAGHSFSRLCAVSVMRRLDYARTEGKAKPLAMHLDNGSLTFAVCCGVLPLLFLPQAFPALMSPLIIGVLLASLATLWLTRMFRRRIGGYTGDCLGAVQQLAEIAFYAGLLCRFS